jgi:hypothetical protein
VRLTLIHCLCGYGDLINFCFEYTAKALELFLSFIVTKAQEVTAERGARKVEPYHVYVGLSSSVYLSRVLTDLHGSFIHSSVHSFMLYIHIFHTTPTDGHPQPLKYNTTTENTQSKQPTSSTSSKKSSNPSQTLPTAAPSTSKPKQPTNVQNAGKESALKQQQQQLLPPPVPPPLLTLETKTPKVLGWNQRRLNGGARRKWWPHPQNRSRRPQVPVPLAVLQTLWL